MRLFRDEEGQTLVLTVFCAAVLLGVLGLAVDAGVLFNARRHMQTAADAAAMAGATEMFYNGTANVTAKAQAAAKANGVDAAAAGNNVFVSTSPTLNPGAVACASCVKVQLSTPNPTIFMATMSQWFFKNSRFNSINVSASAVAGAPGASTTCMYVMDPTASSSLWIHGAGDINAPGCSVYVNSNDPGALCVTGNAGKSDILDIAVVGGQSGKGNCKGDPGTPVYTGAGVQTPAVANQGIPLDPTQNCKSVTTVATLSGSVTGPGYGNYACYTNSCTTTTKKGVTTTTCTPVTLNSATLGAGIYVFESGVKITGATKIGDKCATCGATVVVANGSYDSGTATTFYDYAPADTTSVYNGVAIYQPELNKNPMTLQFGSGSSIFDGAVYAPSAAVTLHDQGGAVNATNLIVGQIYVNGTVNLTNYSDYNPLTTPFLHISLVQ